MWHIYLVYYNNTKKLPLTDKVIYIVVWPCTGIKINKPLTHKSQGTHKYLDRVQKNHPQKPRIFNIQSRSKTTRVKVSIQEGGLHHTITFSSRNKTLAKQYRKPLVLWEIHVHGATGFTDHNGIFSSQWIISNKYSNGIYIKLFCYASGRSHPVQKNTTLFLFSIVMPHACPIQNRAVKQTGTSS